MIPTGVESPQPTATCTADGRAVYFCFHPLPSL
jgi:hypothetical protein